MSNNKGRQLSGTASAVVLTAVGVYLQGTIHPRLALCLYAFAFISCFVVVVQWTWVQKLLGIYHEPLSSLPPSLSAPTTATATGNSAVATGNTLNLHLGPNERELDERMKAIAIQHRGGALVNGDEAILSAAKKVVERPKPNLVSHGIHKEVQAGHNFAFDTKIGDVIYTLRVQNSVRGAIIQGAVASIRFDGKDGMLGMDESAFWYEEYPHEVEFQLNATRSIVLGKFANGRWYHFNNPMRHLPKFNRSSYTGEPDSPKSFALDGDCKMIVEVFNPYRGNDIYLEKLFVISPTATGCAILEGS